MEIDLSKDPIILCTSPVKPRVLSWILIHQGYLITQGIIRPPLERNVYHVDHTSKLFNLDKKRQEVKFKKEKSRNLSLIIKHYEIVSS